MAPSRYDWKIVDWDVKPQHNQQPFSRCKTAFSLNIIPSQQYQIDAKWLEKSLFSDMRVEEQVDA